MDLQSNARPRLTDTAAIDTAPSYSPDGARICFESDRGASRRSTSWARPAAPAQRISFGEGVLLDAGVVAAWGISLPSPSRGRPVLDGKSCAPTVKDERLLTSGYHNGGPTFAPNGRVVDVLP